MNPNADGALTPALLAEVRAALPGIDVDALTASRGPLWVETAVDCAAAAAEVVALLREHPSADGYVIACFSDPGVDAARELVPAPVVGIGEAALIGARLIARRFAVVTTLRRGVGDIEDQVRRAGCAHACVGVLPVERGVGEGAPDAEFVVAARRGVEELGAEAIVLACAGMAEPQAAVEQALGVPALTGLAFGATLCRGLVDAGLRTSPVGAYGAPEPVPYVGADGC